MSTTAAATYAIDKVHSSIGFGVRHNGVSTFRSTFAEYDAAYADGTLTGTAQVASITIDNPDFKAHVLSPEFFDAEAIPTVTFRSTAVREGERDAVEVAGELTIKGITNPVLATGTRIEGANMMGTDVVAFELEATIDRRAYGLNWQAPLPNGGDAVAWDVTLVAHLEFVVA